MKTFLQLPRKCTGVCNEEDDVDEDDLEFFDDEDEDVYTRWRDATDHLDDQEYEEMFKEIDGKYGRSIVVNL